MHTSNIRNAGTDARVFIKIFGTTSSTDKMWLDREEYQDKLFEKGSCDKFLKTFVDIGEPKKITVGHDNSGPFPGWHLDKVSTVSGDLNGPRYFTCCFSKVVLDDIRKKRQYEFKCSRWLAKNEGDGKIEIDIKLDEDEENVNSWNSSGDEDSRMSTSKVVFRQTPTRNVDAVNENPTAPKRTVSAILSSIKVGF
jgi:hypothetical protein